MENPQKADFYQLEAGYEFPPASYQLDSLLVAIYLETVEDTNDLYRETNVIPPMAVAARAMAALSDSISFPAGAIHVSQELEFSDFVRTADTFTSRARVSRKQDRGKLHIVTIEIHVFNQKQNLVLSGKTSFILPESA